MGGAPLVYLAMAVSIFCSPRLAPRAPVQVILLLDAFAHARAPWGDVCYVQDFVEALYFRGITAVAALQEDARILGDDYERMFEAIEDRFSLRSLRSIVLASMGSDLIGSTSPMTLRRGAVADVVERLIDLAVFFGDVGDVYVSLVYGGSGSLWRFPMDFRDDYDEAVDDVVYRVREHFDCATTGAPELRDAMMVQDGSRWFLGTAFLVGNLQLSAIPLTSRL